MNITFVGGTARERALVQQAIDSLMAFDLDLWEIDVTFEWVADPAAQGHNDFAATLTDGNGTGTIQLRNDLDVYGGFGPPFYIETVAHELGHLLTRHLPMEDKEAVAALFGTTVDSIDNYTDDLPWEDRPFEGIAETFKDAFVPIALRQFANRTHIHLPIPEYPALRHIYRAAQREGVVAGNDLMLYGGATDGVFASNGDGERGLLSYDPDDFDGSEGILSFGWTYIARASVGMPTTGGVFVSNSPLDVTPGQEFTWSWDALYDFYFGDLQPEDPGSWTDVSLIVRFFHEGETVGLDDPFEEFTLDLHYRNWNPGWVPDNYPGPVIDSPLPGDPWSYIRWEQTNQPVDEGRVVVTPTLPAGAEDTFLYLAPGVADEWLPDVSPEVQITVPAGAAFMVVAGLIFTQDLPYLHGAPQGDRIAAQAAHLPTMPISGSSFSIEPQPDPPAGETNYGGEKRGTRPVDRPVHGST